MRKNRPNIILFLVVIFLFASCIKPSGVLKSSEMEDVLFDIHKTEGILTVEGNGYDSPEAKSAYQDEVLRMHHVSQADFDSSLVWYSKHPKAFESIYHKVVTRLDSLASDVQNGKVLSTDTTQDNIQNINLWTLPNAYILTKDSARNKVRFEVPNHGNLLFGDKYILSFLQRVSPCDSSTSPRIVMYVNYLDGRIDSINTKIHNDSILRRYTIIFGARDTSEIRSITGYLLDYSVEKGEVGAYLDSIKLTRRFDIYKQNYYRQLLEKPSKKGHENKHKMHIPPKIRPQINNEIKALPKK